MILSKRLDLVSRRGALSTADLARWFQIPYPTIRSWRMGTIPSTASLPQIEQALSCLESAVAGDKRLPIPLTVRAADRPAYLLAVRRDAFRKR